MSILDRQQKFRELGRIRMGDKGGTKGAQRKLEKWRLTSPNQVLLERAAELWGGQVQEWKGAPAGTQWELYTDAVGIPVVIPPQVDPITQSYELWTGGGCTRRCDGFFEERSSQRCLCRKETGSDDDEDMRDKRQCTPHTRVSVMLPDVSDVGHWRLTTKGYNAADELPTSMAVLESARAAGHWLEGEIRIEQRQSRDDGQVHNFVVPVISLAGIRMREVLESGGDGMAQIGVGGTGTPSPPVSAQSALDAGAADGVAQLPASSEGDSGGVPLPSAVQAEAEEASTAQVGDNDHLSQEPPPAETPASQPQVESPASAPYNDQVSAGQRKMLFAHASELGVDRDDVRDIVRMSTGTPLSELPGEKVEYVMKVINSFANPDKREANEAKLATWIREHPELRVVRENEAQVSMLAADEGDEAGSAGPYTGDAA